MARWQDLRRAIRNKDAEGAERLWFELIEAGAEDVAPFLDAADMRFALAAAELAFPTFLAWALLSASLVGGNLPALRKRSILPHTALRVGASPKRSYSSTTICDAVLLFSAASIRTASVSSFQLKYVICLPLCWWWKKSAGPDSRVRPASAPMCRTMRPWKIARAGTASSRRPPAG